ncbi:MAG: serine hydrolase [Alphaproteobacteria bacterium]|nr:serine hydrolase [Alphaproteobacteria bacterium]
MNRLLISAAVVFATMTPIVAQTQDDAGCRAAIRFHEDRNGSALLVLRDGQVACEAYARGANAETGIELWSGTKSFSGMLAAAAVQDGLLTLDEPIAKTIVEWIDDRRSSATIRQLLSLTSGIQTRIAVAPSYADSVWLPFASNPGTRFQYGASPYQLFGEVMTRKLAATSQPPDIFTYLKRRILDPIGLTPTRWRRTTTGDLLLPQGAAMSARDWAKFGELVRLGGVNNGRALVDPMAFREQFVGTTANPGYGLTWWLPAPERDRDIVSETVDIGRRGGVPKDLVTAAGAGDQRLYVVPSLGLTIVRQAAFTPQIDAPLRQRGGAGPPWSDAAFFGTLLGSR